MLANVHSGCGAGGSAASFLFFYSLAIGRAPFLDLMRSRHIENTSRELLDGACLLCSEETPHHCHRRLVAEYLKQHWRDVEIEPIP